MIASLFGALLLAGPASAAVVFTPLRAVSPQWVGGLAAAGQANSRLNEQAPQPIFQTFLTPDNARALAPIVLALEAKGFTAESFKTMPPGAQIGAVIEAIPDARKIVLRQSARVKAFATQPGLSLKDQEHALGEVEKFKEWEAAYAIGKGAGFSDMRALEKRLVAQISAARQSGARAIVSGGVAASGVARDAQASVSVPARRRGPMSGRSPDIQAVEDRGLELAAGLPSRLKADKIEAVVFAALRGGEAAQRAGVRVLLAAAEKAGVPDLDENPMDYLAGIAAIAERSELSNVKVVALNNLVDNRLGKKRLNVALLSEWVVKAAVSAADKRVKEEALAVLLWRVPKAGRDEERLVEAAVAAIKSSTAETLAVPPPGHRSIRDALHEKRVDGAVLSASGLLMTTGEFVFNSPGVFAAVAVMLLIVAGFSFFYPLRRWFRDL